MQRRQFLALSSAFFVSLVSLKANDFSKVKLGFLPITDHFLMIAKELYPDSFQSIKFNSWPDLSEALRAGSIDGAFMLNPLALKLSTQLPLKSIMATHRNGSVLSVKKEINSINDLKGKKIAIPSRFSTHFLLLNTLLTQNNIKLSEVNLIDMAPSEMPFALKNGSIDAFLVAQPFGNLANSLNISKSLKLSSQILPNHTCCQFVVNKNLYENKDKLQGLVNNFVKTAKFINENKDEAIILGNKVLGHKKELLASVIRDENLISFSNLKVSQNDFDIVISGMKDAGVENFNISYSDFVDISFITKAYVNNA
ncbi:MULTISPECIES: ABC transporter substrate-binding protein [unclassified Campylobacter]|uniref:ABC transporter substrate-binding protein n=1 Tax=unclassified Campylobacter TaxID=2593542 RepID=UPI001237A04A|nr:MULTISPECIES: ABC transporter substrate-binding protein [unclassified Campylobacter]KAA6225635.1 ABC transporter substrate-binding protein [Campylobacter sp. LR185c]KAA6227513.1 ABC transporter substrate-binding protein [Campylobacter sp. LR196d]KAA6228540.1 ABC transporter substrate-binding protein [Campylobacter sp. LR286c]KAA6230930.1 ABC transporter substrate-binding protein [Campylobacter sp. LR291e]KAA6233564.1 ABC transporter substrate-binding protein [Campylobacter sp. LR264d]